MATSELTIASVAKRLDPKGKAADIAEILQEDNDILDDLNFVEANDITSHVTTVRSLLPSGSWPARGGYVDPEKSETRQIREQIGTLKSYSNVPKDIAKLYPSIEAFRKTEDEAFLQGLSQTMAETFIYGKPAEAGAFPGLHERYNALSMSNVATGGASSGDITSIWIVQHGTDGLHAVYPRGSKAGLEHNNLGEVTEQNSSGQLRQVLRSEFLWSMGMVVRDDRAVQRIANVKVVAASADYSAFDDLIIKALNKMPKRGKGAVIYVNRDMMSMFDILAKDKSNVAYGSSEVFGKQVVTFRGTPIKLVEAITSAESVIS